MKPPCKPPEREWRPETRAWWEAIWTSPCAALWEPYDVVGLLRTAGLVDEFWRTPLASERLPEIAAELRELEDRYGLNPLARARLLAD
jgi:hypothetical protein